MNFVNTGFALLFTSVFFLPDNPLPKGKDAARKDAPSAMVDFASLRNIPGEGTRIIRLIVKTTNGPTYNMRVTFDLSETSGRGVCACFSGSMEESGWTVEEKGSILTITGFGKGGDLKTINGLRITSEGAFPPAFLPLVIATDNVKVERDAKPVVTER